MATPLQVPPCFARAFEQFQTGEYARQLDQIESAFYSAAKREREPRLRFRRDVPPFLGAGALQSQDPVVVTFGLNPKRDREESPPSSPEEYFQAALDHFAHGPPSPHHRVYLDLLEGIFGSAWRNAWRKQYATFDLFPWYSGQWSVSRLAQKHIPYIRGHMADCAELLAAMDVQLAVFNGRLWSDVLQHVDPPLFASDFQPQASVAYRLVDPRCVGGEVVIGSLQLRPEQTVPAVVLNWFIHQTRPPLSADCLRLLGQRIRPQLP